MLYPEQNDRRNRLDLSGFWDFALDPDDRGERDGYPRGLPEPRPIAVPASWNEQWSDARDHLGPAWYLREFWVPEAWLGDRVFLRVGSANYAARVWINGEYLGEHEGGHLPFAFEIGPQVRAGEANTLAIRVENRLEPTRVPPSSPGEDDSGVGDPAPIDPDGWDHRSS